MIFSKSITFDSEEIGQAVVSPKHPAVLTSEDGLFLDRLKAGDAQAFDTLVDRYSGDIHALLFRITENAEETNDLTQDTFLRALRSMSFVFRHAVGNNSTR